MQEFKKDKVLNIRVSQEFLNLIDYFSERSFNASRSEIIHKAIESYCRGWDFLPSYKDLKKFDIDKICDTEPIRKKEKRNKVFMKHQKRAQTL